MNSHEELDNHSRLFNEFLDTTYVKRLRGRDHKPLQNVKYLETADIATFLLSLVEEFALDKSSGQPFYSVTAYDSSQPTIDFLLDCIRSGYWLRFCTIIGRKEFVNILNNAESFMSKSNHVYWIFIRCESIQRSLSNAFLSKSAMMYSTGFKRRNLTLMLESIEEMVRCIEFPKFVNTKNVPKRLRKLTGLLRRAKVADSKMNYAYLFEDQITKLSYQPYTSLHDVARFILVVIEKLFTSSFWGNAWNRNCFREFLIDYLKSPKKTSTSIGDLVNALKIRHIRWLYKTDERLSLREKEHSEQLFFRFMTWMFRTFLVRLIKAFWYVSETSGYISSDGSHLVYIPHRDWSSMSDLWLEGYAHEYLTQNNPNAIERPRYKEGALRLVPKKHDFRPLCVPLRYQRLPKAERLLVEEVRDSYIFEKNVLAPVRDIIRHQQTKRSVYDFEGHAKCFSVDEVVRSINRYKENLSSQLCLSKAKLSVIKFDMKHCYDNLNQAKIIQTVKELFRGDKHDLIFLRKALKYKSTNLTFPKLLSSITDRNNLERSYQMGLRGKESVVKGCQKSITQITHLRVFDVLDVVLDQILNGTIRLQSSKDVYSRKRGVFQGTALLATFCDLLYDQLISESFKFLNETKDTILIRLADDFLVLLLNPNTCQRVFQVACSQKFKDFGAYINEEKSQFHTTTERTSIDFVGLEITLPTLDILRRSSFSLNIPRKVVGSFRTLLDYMVRVFEYRLPKEFFKSAAISGEAVKINVMHVLNRILKVVGPIVSRSKNDSTSFAQDIDLFCKKLIYTIWAKFKGIQVDQQFLLHLCNSLSRRIYKAMKKI